MPYKPRGVPKRLLAVLTKPKFDDPVPVIELESDVVQLMLKNVMTGSRRNGDCLSVYTTIRRSLPRSTTPQAKCGWKILMIGFRRRNGS